MEEKKAVIVNILKTAQELNMIFGMQVEMINPTILQNLNKIEQKVLVKNMKNPI